jgi:membrane protease YdiL (CAAX protease family)
MRVVHSGKRPDLQKTERGLLLGNARRQAAVSPNGDYHLPMQARRSVVLEVAALALATAVFLATFQVRASYVDFALAAAAVALIVASARRSRRLWELARPTAAGDEAARGSYRSAVLLAAAFTVAALAVLAVLAMGWPPASAAGRPTLERFFTVHLFAAMLLYFPWALLQQYIFQFYLFGRLLHLLPAAAAVAVTALAFASVHFPRWPVMIVTLVAGSVWTQIYYRHRVLLPLAASHAILGAALHYWVFGNDLLATWSSALPSWLVR